MKPLFLKKMHTELKMNSYFSMAVVDSLKRELIQSILSLKRPNKTIGIIIYSLIIKHYSFFTEE